MPTAAVVGLGAGDGLPACGAEGEGAGDGPGVPDGEGEGAAGPSGAATGLRSIASQMPTARTTASATKPTSFELMVI